MNFSECKKHRNAVTEDQINEIQAFYEQDDISRMCPGKKETKSIKTATGHALRQKRYLIMNVNEAYQLYKENSLMKVGRSKFSELRPDHVTLISDKDQNVCMCQYQENLTMLLAGIAKVCILVPISPYDIVKEICCEIDENHIKCINRQCEDCGCGSYLDTVIPVNLTALNQPVTYYQWSTCENG